MISKNEKWTDVSPSDIKEEDVIFWNKIVHDDGTETAHVGFALNDKEAVSTDYKTKMIIKHSNRERNIEKVYRHNW